MKKTIEKFYKLLLGLLFFGILFGIGFIAGTFPNVFLITIILSILIITSYYMGTMIYDIIKYFLNKKRDKVAE